MQMMFKRRLTRRLITLPAVVVATVLAVVTAPVWIILTSIADAIMGWKRHRCLRVGLTMTAYVLNECWGMVAMFLIWVFTGLGWRIRGPLSMRLHGYVHGRWTKNLFWCTKHILGADVTITNADVLEPSPVAVLSRHISLLDAVVPSVLLCSGQPHTPRHVLMQELLWAPSFDVVGHRTPNSFVDRRVGGEKALDEARWVGSTAQSGGSVVIFPEGGFRTPRRFARSIERLRERHPDLADRASSLQHVLPPRPGGSRALLEGAAGVDVVLIAHTGYEAFGSLKQIIRSVPFVHPVEVNLKRIPRSQVPMGEAEFHDWILRQFEWIDAWVEERMIANGVKATETIDVTELDITATVEHNETVGGSA